MSVNTTSHFLLCPSPGWGKNFQSSLQCNDIHLISLIGHVRPFCTLATRLVREQENIIVTLIVAPNVLDKTRNEITRQILDEPSGSSKAVERIR